MDREQALRWLVHRINNPKVYVPFDWSFISNYLKHTKDYDITPTEVEAQARAVNFDITRNLSNYFGNLMNHVLDTFNINIVFDSQEENNKKLLKIY